MVVMPVIKLSPNLASKGSEARVARFVEPPSEAGSIAGQPLRKRSPSTHSGCFCCLAANYQRATSCPPRKSWASAMARKKKQPGNPLLRCAFLAVRAKWILSCDKCQASPDHFGAHPARFAENLTPKITMRVPFCQYSNTIMHPLGHAAPRVRAVAL